MNKKYYIIVALVLCSTTSLFAQKDVRQFLRKGNTAYKDSLFVDAEVAYRKAIDSTPKEEIGTSYYNLGNALVQQSKYQEAIKEFAYAADIETNKKYKSEALHNMGVIFQADEQLDKAIEVYKEALRNNPKDDETRYNLALALKQKSEQDQNQDGKDNQDQKDKEEDKNEQNEDKNQDQQQQQQNNNQDQKKENEDEQNQSQGGKNAQSLSKEAVDQMLDAILRDEKKTQEKVQKQQVLRGKNKLEKDW